MDFVTQSRSRLWKCCVPYIAKSIMGVKQYDSCYLCLNVPSQCPGINIENRYSQALSFHFEILPHGHPRVLKEIYEVSVTKIVSAFRIPIKSPFAKLITITNNMWRSIRPYVLYCYLQMYSRLVQWEIWENNTWTIQLYPFKLMETRQLCNPLVAVLWYIIFCMNFSLTKTFIYIYEGTGLWRESNAHEDYFNKWPIMRKRVLYRGTRNVWLHIFI